MKIIAITQKGLNKSENEDRVVVGKSIIASGTFLADVEDGIIAVADGVGGHNAGAVASHFVANNIGGLKEVSFEQMEQLNYDLVEVSKTHAEHKGMATTLSGVCLSNEKTQLFSVGNTRVYLLQSRKYLKQLTTDDTTLNYLLATGQLSPEEAENFDRKNEITACFGGGNPEFFRIKISNIEPLVAPFMLTTDGIHDYLSVDELEEKIEMHGLTELCCWELIEAARNNGSIDDASIILGGI
jgi:protein phosphatase